MRFLPFAKRKGGIQFAGVGVSTDGASVDDLPTEDSKNAVSSGWMYDYKESVDGQLEALTDTLNSMSQHSTDEHFVGFWIDGKSIYEKSIYYEGASNLPSAWGFTATDVDLVVSISGICNKGSGVLPVNYYYGSSNQCIVFGRLDNGTLTLDGTLSSTFSGTHKVLINVRYIKTESEG